MSGFNSGSLGSLALVMVASACAETPSPTMVDAPEAFFTVTGAGDWTDLNFSPTDSCNGERVDMETRVKFVVSSSVDRNGGVHISVHRTWIGTGVGQDTGTEYILNWPLQRQFNERGPFPVTRRVRLANNLVTKGSADNRILSAVMHTTINANGEITVEFREIVFACLG